MDTKKDNRENTTRVRDRLPGEEEFGYSTTVEIPRNTFSEKASVEQRAFFELILPGQADQVVELGKEEMTIGRSPNCSIHLPLDNVSRVHGRVTFRNEEYAIEDLGSTNGVFVNGVRISKCVLRNNDFVEIGGVKLLFLEEKILQKR